MSRLTNVLPCIISPKQVGFVKGRSINDNILLAQELLQSIKKKIRRSNLIMKLDITKAYDSISWLALIKVLRKFGFNERTIDMIWRLISSCWYSVLINGKSCGFFTSNRGFRQGDPLSPVLYIIASEILSRGLSFMHENLPSIRYSSITEGPIISHLSYADDIIIFCNGCCPSLKLHMDFLSDVFSFLGLSVNKSKSCFITARPDNSKD